NLNMGERLDHTLFLSSLYKNTSDYIMSFDEFEFWTNPLDKKGLGGFIQLSRKEVLSILRENISLVTV
ncbi:MAG: hypothetical protein ACRC5T_05165, partial [Cetobacterium sp.]